jgi:hypothetical protein
LNGRIGASITAVSRNPFRTSVRLLLQKAAKILAAPWRVGLLLLVTTLVWCAHYDRWTAESWQLPTDYSGDAPEILTQMKAASEGAMWPLQAKIVERLGAPFGAYWNAYPTPDKPLMLLAGALAHVVGLFAAANLALLLAPLSAALAFYFVARWLRCRWEWAWAGALLFAFTYHTFHRGLGHFSITFSWTVPLGLLATWLVARSKRLEWRSWGAVVCLGSAFALGISNPYNLFFWLQLMGWAMIAQCCSERRRANLMIGAAAIAIAGAAFVAANVEVWAYVDEPDGAPLIARNYGGTEMYALKPMEMVIPPPYHRWSTLAFLGNRYIRWSVWRGEVFLPYLGIIGIAALLWLGTATVWRLLKRQPVPGPALSIGWLVAYAMVGGITNLVALVAGLQMFRATNRVAVFVSAILLVFLVVRLARLTARWPAWTRLSAAFGLAAIGVIDQVPQEAPTAEKHQIADAVESDRALGRELESALPHGAMIFQLPVVGFPEVTPPNRLADYELFRPFLHTDTLRFSYGAAKFRARSRWQRDLENAPAGALVKRLEAWGFAALYINRKGYEDRAERLLKELDRLGYSRRIEGRRGQQVVVLLHPRAEPVLPLGRALTYGHGWHPRIDEGVRWANDDAFVSYYNPYPHPIVAALNLELVGVDRRKVWLERRHEQLGAVNVGEQPTRLAFPRLTLHPGVNVFVLRSEESGVRFDNARYGMRTFGLKSASIRVDAHEPAAALFADDND